MNILKDLFGIDTDTSVKELSEDIQKKPDEFAYKARPISLEILQRLIPLRTFPVEELRAFSWNRTAEVYTKGSVLFRRDHLARYLYYLLEGVVRIEVDEHNSYEIAANSELTKFPICGGSSYSATCIAATKVQVLRISHKVLAWQGYNSRVPPTNFIEIDEEAIPKSIRTSQFYQVFYQDFRGENLRLKALPEVVKKLRMLMAHEVGLRSTIQLMQVEPTLALKLLQLSNSGLYLPGPPVNNCYNAVYRLGLSATKSLVVDECMNDTYSMQDPFLVQLIHDEWKNSIYLSKLCRALAEGLPSVNPKSAQLAGLVANIGKIPILAFAENFPTNYWKPEDLFNVLHALQDRVGAYVLAHAGFPQELVDVPLIAEDWLLDNGKPLSLSDIVVLAKMHSVWGTEESSRHLPSITVMPAFSKFSRGRLSPERSLQLLNEAKRKAGRVFKLFKD